MEEEVEARLAQEMRDVTESEDDVVIIDEHSPSSPVPPHRPPHLHSHSFTQPRELVRQHAVQVSLELNPAANVAF